MCITYPGMSTEKITTEFFFFATSILEIKVYLFYEKHANCGEES